MAQTRRTSRILIAEENSLFRHGLKALFSSDAAFSVVGEASESEQILAQVRELRPDALVISAVLLLRNQGTDLGTAIRQVPELRTLVLAGEDSEENLSAAITCGAKGLLLKGTTPVEMTAALRKVVIKESSITWPGLLPDLEALATHTPLDTATSVLTAREQEVVRILAEGKTVRLAANELGLSMKTVEAHKLNLMRKLDIHDRASLVAYATRNGLTASAELRA